MKLRNKNIMTKTETKYLIDINDFKQSLGLPNKEISFIWLSFDGDKVEITLKE